MTLTLKELEKIEERLYESGWPHMEIIRERGLRVDNAVLKVFEMAKDSIENEKIAVENLSKYIELEVEFAQANINMMKLLDKLIIYGGYRDVDSMLGIIKEYKRDGAEKK